MSPDSIAAVVDKLMPQLTKELVQLTRIPSISAPGFPVEPIHEACKLVMDLVRDAGVGNVRTLDLPKTFPVVLGEIPAPPGAPTLLLYGALRRRADRRRVEVDLAGLRARPSATAACTAAASRIRRPISWPTSARCGPSAASLRSASRS